ncbi:MAG: hypothetical protein ABSB29_01820 [Nitrososphaerales archaeon]
MPLPQDRRSRLLVVALILALSAAFAILAYDSPVKSRPEVCTKTGGGGGYTPMAYEAMAICVPAKISNPLYAHAVSQFLFYQSYAEIAEGLAVVAVLSVLLLALGTRINLHTFAFLSKPHNLSRRLRTSVLSLAWLFIILYLIVVALNLLPDIIPSTKRFIYDMDGRYLSFHTFQTTGTSLGVLGFLFLISAGVFLAIYWMNKGISKSLQEVIKFLIIPMVFAHQVALLLVNLIEMPDHVTNFATWSYAGVYLMSNWFVLVVSSFFVVLGVISLLSPKLKR